MRRPAVQRAFHVSWSCSSKREVDPVRGELGDDAEVDVDPLPKSSPELLFESRALFPAVFLPAFDTTDDLLDVYHGVVAVFLADPEEFVQHLWTAGFFHFGVMIGVEPELVLFAVILVKA